MKLWSTAIREFLEWLKSLVFGPSNKDGPSPPPPPKQ